MNDPLRFVVDTNVVISALLLKHSPSRSVIDKALEIGTVLLSNETIAELQDVIHRPKFDKYVTPSVRRLFVEQLIEDATRIDVTVTITDCRDAKDNKFLEVAVSGQAHYIVSGDKDLLDLHPYRGIAIINPNMFLKEFAA